MTAMMIAVAGGLGAALRVGVGMAVYRSHHERLSLGTAVVNLSGAFAYGALLGSGVSGPGTDVTLGFLAGFTTFSTWIIEVTSAWEEGRSGRRRAVLHVIVMLASGLLATAAGYWVVR